MLRLLVVGGPKPGPCGDPPGGLLVALMGDKFCGAKAPLLGLFVGNAPLLVDVVKPPFGLVGKFGAGIEPCFAKAPAGARF